MPSLDQAMIDRFPNTSGCIVLIVERKSDMPGKPWHLNYGIIEDRLLHHPQVVDLAVDFTDDTVYVALTRECYDLEALIELDGELSAVITECVNRNNP